MKRTPRMIDNSLSLSRLRRSAPLDNDFRREARERLMRFVTIDACGCWIFGGSTSGEGRGGGYGRLRFRGQYYAAHRLSYLAFKGPIAAGRHVGHCCPSKNPPDRRCINPEHVEQMSPAKNQRQRVKQMKARGHPVFAAGDDIGGAEAMS
jgi:hypothetical protein